MSPHSRKIKVWETPRILLKSVGKSVGWPIFLPKKAQKREPMKKSFFGIAILIFGIMFWSGCTSIGEKTSSLSLVYAITAVLSLLLLVGYCCLLRKKNTWLLLLFASVFVVNTGYFCLAVSRTLEEALLANRISYLGSVFLPLSMLMIILQVTRLNTKKWLPALLLILSIGVFFVAASPGYLDIYYKEVTIETVNGVTVLNKVYGPWHKIYLFYLAGYFAAMVAAVIRALAEKKIFSNIHAVFLAAAVFVNIGVWLIEQLVKLEFEYLSVSYIISELFLLGLYLLLQESEKAAPAEAENAPVPAPVEEAAQERICGEEESERIKSFVSGIASLTQTESIIYTLYTEGRTTKEIMEELCIKENTLKYHNKNIYGKLGVSSRKQLMEIAASLEKETE